MRVVHNPVFIILEAGVEDKALRDELLECFGGSLSGDNCNIQPRMVDLYEKLRDGIRNREEEQ